jgi:hypothetical protein
MSPVSAATSYPSFGDYYSYIFLFYSKYASIIYYLVFSRPDVALASPKSQILTLQSSFMRIFAGLISLCKIVAECIYFRAHSKLYIIV